MGEPQPEARRADTESLGERGRATLSLLSRAPTKQMGLFQPPDSVVFDLDGTLWDTCATCAVAWNQVLQRHGIAFRPITEHDVRRVTGRPHDECIRVVFTDVAEGDLLTLIAETQVEDNRLVGELGGALSGRRRRPSATPCALSALHRQQLPGGLRRALLRLVGSWGLLSGLRVLGQYRLVQVGKPRRLDRAQRTPPPGSRRRYARGPGRGARVRRAVPVRGLRLRRVRGRRSPLLLVRASHRVAARPATAHALSSVFPSPRRRRHE